MHYSFTTFLATTANLPSFCEYSHVDKVNSWPPYFAVASILYKLDFLAFDTKSLKSASFFASIK